MRKLKTKIRQTPQDEVYQNASVTKLINRSMRDGKRSVAQGQVYEAFEAIQKETGEDPLKVFLKAVENIKPNMEVRPKRIGGAAYQIPAPVRGPRKESLAIRWLIAGANARHNKEYKTYANKLKAEILDAAKGGGFAVGKRQEIERIAEANKAFAHFKW